MEAIVTAGGMPKPDDPLYAYSQGRPKALIELGGRPMIQWVLDAMGDSANVDRVVVAGLADQHGLTCAKPMAFVPNQGGMLQNIRAGVLKALEINPRAEFVVNVSSDIPATEGGMVDWVIDEALKTEHDLYYSAIARAVMESRYPGSNRSYLKLRDVEVCGGDIHIIRAKLITSHQELWERLLESRKSVVKQAALIGFDTLFLLLIRRLTLGGGVQRVNHRLGIRGRVLLCPYAEIAMDVDKPFQLDIVSADLQRKDLV